MDIIIGREEGTRRLHCVVGEREFNIGQAGSVPLSVSRKHCKISVDGSNITIENIKAENVTFVDGNQVLSKSISAASKVQLGVERFLMPLQQILQLATGAPVGQQQQPDVPTFSLKPLEGVWEEYHSRRLELQKEAADFANKQRLQGIISMLGMCVGAAIPVVRWILMGCCLLLAFYFFYKSSNNPILQQQLDDLDEEFAKKYTCPNPKCGKPFGNVPYRNIKYNKQCFACGCKYTH